MGVKACRLSWTSFQGIAVAHGKIDKVDIQGESTPVYFLDEEGDKEEASFVRQDGQWKAWLTMPRVSQP